MIFGDVLEAARGHYSALARVHTDHLSKELKRLFSNPAGTGPVA